MKKIIALCAVGVLGFAACGDDDDDTTDSTVAVLAPVGTDAMDDAMTDGTDAMDDAMTDGTDAMDDAMTDDTEG